MVKLSYASIEGTWLPFKAELDGQQAPDLALSKICLVIGTEDYSVQFGNETTDAGSYTLGMATEILTITLVSHSGVNKGRTIPSIYQLVGDRLRICFGLKGELPKEFAAGVGSNCYMVTYRRKN